VILREKLFLVLNLTTTANRIVEINAIADTAHLHQLDPVVLDT
jgi:hypothetical protein